VRFSSDALQHGLQLDSVELPTNSDTAYEGGNLGHASAPRAAIPGFRRSTPARTCAARCSRPWRPWASKVEKHHHEVASAQHELGLQFETLVTVADHLQIYKYAIHAGRAFLRQVATFMPKPVFGDNGSGMHVHQSIWKEGKPVFAGRQIRGLSQECLWYIGGIIKHAKSLNAFTNPSTNSYKRLVPGYEAPVLLAYSSRNRSPPAASLRLEPKAKRIEVRFPDPTANPISPSPPC